MNKIFRTEDLLKIQKNTKEFLMMDEVEILENNKAKGNIVKKPTTNLAELKVKGPILSIPVSCAIKAVPHKKEQVIAQVKAIKFLLMLFIIVI